MEREKEKRAGWTGRRLSGSWAVLCLALMLAISGCAQRPASTNGNKVVDAEFTRGQIMVVAATERNRYQNIYTGDLWPVKADSDGTTFEEKLMDQIGQFLIELATTNLMADEEGVELTGQEKDDLKNLTKEYYHKLSEQDRDYLGVSEDEVYDLYCRYFRADKLVAELTKAENLEVSDAEAKVIQIQQIRLDSRQEAETVLTQVQTENADFSSVAARASKDSQIQHTLEWSKDMDVLGKAAFDLEQDHTSGILEQDGSFYILKCINAYDVDATVARKKRLGQEKKTRAFLDIYEPFVKEHTVKLKEDLGQMVDFTKGEECRTDNFFQMYHGYFN